MDIHYFFFDLDGTLLPMDQDVFVKAYFGRLAAKLASHGYDPKALINAIWGGTAAMIKNDGSCTNEEAFWNYFASVFGEEAVKDEPLFTEFYHTDFQQVQSACGYTPKAAAVIDFLKSHERKLVLATNPIFPAIATESRIHWAGLNQEDFVLYTTYENSSHCKPNPAYYQDILAQLGAKPEQCLMIGNDVREDMVAAAQAGIKGFLLTDCIINKDAQDISCYPHGDFDALMNYLHTLV